MMNKIAITFNDALRKRWSTVLFIAFVLTAGKAYADWSPTYTPGTIIAQTLFTFIISFIVSLVLHVLLFTIFSPKKKEMPIVVHAPTKSKDEHEAMIKAVNKELEAITKADIAANPSHAPKVEKTHRPIDLRKELHLPKEHKKAKSAKSKKPAKKSAAKKKK